MATPKTKKFPPIRVDRLRQLAKHLRGNKLGHDSFYFGTWNSSDFRIREGEGIIPDCGTSGCAIGECPAAFPKQWVFSTADKYPCLKKDGRRPIYGNPQTSGEKFFGLTSAEFSHLFLPERQSPHVFGGRGNLDATADADRVADNIEYFILQLEESPWR